MKKYFTADQTQHYHDILLKILDSYNNSYHRSIERAPNKVRKQDEKEIWVRLYGDGSKGQTWEEKKNQMLHVSKVKGAFDKGYVPNWGEEDFLIQSQRRNPRTVLKLADKGGEPIKGSWYPEELQEIKTNRYLIEKILRRRTDPKKGKEGFVKWKGWPQKFNTWIPASDLEYVA